MQIIGIDYKKIYIGRTLLNTITESADSERHLSSSEAEPAAVSPDTEYCPPPALLWCISLCMSLHRASPRSLLAPPSRPESRAPLTPQMPVHEDIRCVISAFRKTIMKRKQCEVCTFGMLDTISYVTPQEYRTFFKDIRLFRLWVKLCETSVMYLH